MGGQHDDFYGQPHYDYDGDYSGAPYDDIDPTLATLPPTNRSITTSRGMKQSSNIPTPQQFPPAVVSEGFEMGAQGRNRDRMYQQPPTGQYPPTNRRPPPGSHYPPPAGGAPQQYW